MRQEQKDAVHEAQDAEEEEGVHEVVRHKLGRRREPRWDEEGAKEQQGVPEEEGGHVERQLGLPSAWA